ncbi:unnamed protein product [Pylaiella littoralis]
MTHQPQPPPPPPHSSPAPSALPEAGGGGSSSSSGGGGGGGGGGTRWDRWDVAVQDRWLFTFLLCKLLNGLPSKTHGGRFEHAAEGSIWPDKPRTRFRCLKASTERVKNLLLPHLLRATATALLSFPRGDATARSELQEHQELMLLRDHPPTPGAVEREAAAEIRPPSTTSSSSCSTSEAALVGAGATKMGGMVKDAVWVKLSVRLAQAPSQLIFALAARHVPKILLPRLLLASRPDTLGESADNADELYQGLISPDPRERSIRAKISSRRQRSGTTSGACGLR